MAIEIYDKAAIVRKEKKVYFLVKYGSKNSFTLGRQRVTGDDFRKKYIARMTRDSNWNVVAHGTLEHLRDDKIAETYWNSPTSNVYGQIRFGNKKNIALYFAKNKDRPLDYDALDDDQKRNIERIIGHTEKHPEYTIDLANIEEHKKSKNTASYCGNEIEQDASNRIVYHGRNYWNLDNL